VTTLRSASIPSVRLSRPGLLLAALPALVPLLVPAAQASTEIAVRLDQPVIGGLRVALSGTACAGGYDVVGVQLPDAVCTHGPDRTPPAGLDAIDDGNGEAAAATTAPATTAPATTAPAADPTAGAVACYSDGTNGTRVQVLYAHTTDVADQFATVAPKIPAWAATVDHYVAASAAARGGTRHVRYVVDGNCQLQVTDVTMASGGADTLTKTINELVAHGYNRPDRKYLVFVDSSVYCGISTIASDDSPWSTNANNNHPEYARVDRPCWGGGAPAHELMHALGAVQLSAPHTSGAYHCYDGADIMCYNDNGSYFANGGTMKQVCTTTGMFDCNNDDYFDAGTPAPGSYLATHWNAALNVALDTRAGSATAPGPDNAPPVAPTPPPRSETRNGSVSMFSANQKYSWSTGSGPMDAVLTFNGSLTMTLTDGAGHLLGQASGEGPLHISQSVIAGTNTISVNKGGGLLGTSFQLQVTYPTRG